MAEGTSIAGLAGSLAEKLARDVRRICKQQQEVSACWANLFSLMARPRAVVVCAVLGQRSVGEALDSSTSKQDRMV